MSEEKFAEALYAVLSQINKFTIVDTYSEAGGDVTGINIIVLDKPLREIIKGALGDE